MYLKNLNLSVSLLTCLFGMQFASQADSALKIVSSKMDGNGNFYLYVTNTANTAFYVEQTQDLKSWKQLHLLDGYASGYMPITYLGNTEKMFYRLRRLSDVNVTLDPSSPGFQVVTDFDNNIVAGRFRLETETRASAFAFALTLLPIYTNTFTSALQTKVTINTNQSTAFLSVGTSMVPWNPNWQLDLSNLLEVRLVYLPKIDSQHKPGYRIVLGFDSSADQQSAVSEKQSGHNLKLIGQAMSSEIRVFRTKPTLKIVEPPQGSDYLLVHSIESNGHSDLTVANLRYRFDLQNASMTGASLRVFTDPSLSQPLAGNSIGPNGILSTVTLESDASGKTATFTNVVVVAEASTYYFAISSEGLERKPNAVVVSSLDSNVNKTFILDTFEKVQKSTASMTWSDGLDIKPGDPYWASEFGLITEPISQTRLWP